jgi:hypothetical protein
MGWIAEAQAEWRGTCCALRQLLTGSRKWHARLFVVFLGLCVGVLPMWLILIRREELCYMTSSKAQLSREMVLRIVVVNGSWKHLDLASCHS